MKNELLCPCGSLEAVKVAINSGADAVYCAGKHFGARAYVTNLSNDEIIDASKFVHLHSKKIYITLNTLIFEEEFEEVKAYIDFLYQYVDALIVQDFGVVHYMRLNYPDFPVHLSTQTSIHNKQDILFLKSLGISRVVLAREVSLEEIKEFNKLGIELEIFIHGALCFSYSGMCYLSYYKGGRSGNRGTCAQPCRQNYELLEDSNKISEGALLSMKDLNTISHIEDVLSLGVASLKIEGRAKSLDYLASVTKIYRKLIDDYNAKIKPKVSSDMLLDLYSSFSREITSGYLFNENNKDVTTNGSVKHQGVLIGKVLEYKNNQIKVKLEKPLELLDGIRIIDKNKETGLTVTRIIENGNLVKSSTGVVYIDIKEKISPNSLVFKTQSSKVKKELKTYQNISKAKARLEIILSENKQILKLKVNDINVVKTFNNSLEKAINIFDDKIIEQFKKTNSLPIEYSDVSFSNKNGLFVPIPLINKMRGELLEEVKEKLEKQKMREYLPYPFTFEGHFINEKPCDYLELKEDEDYDFTLIKNEELKKNNLAFHLAEISSDSVISPYFGVNNIYAVSFFRNLTSGVIILSYESSYQNALSLYNYDKALGYLVDYYEPLMISKHCVVAKAKGYDKKGCGECNRHHYQIKDNDNIYNLKFSHCYMRILGREIKRNRSEKLVSIALL